MRTLLFMSIIGVTLYGLIVVTNHFLPQQAPEFLSAKDSSDANRTLRSWGRNLPELVVQSRERQGSASQNATMAQAAVANTETLETELAGAKTSAATAALNSTIERAKAKSAQPIPRSPKKFALQNSITRKANRSMDYGVTDELAQTIGGGDLDCLDAVSHLLVPRGNCPSCGGARLPSNSLRGALSDLSARCPPLLRDSRGLRLRGPLATVCSAIKTFAL
jgi:hypothetical protein